MLPKPFLASTITFLFVDIPINFGCQSQHFYCHLHLHSSSLCLILCCFFFHSIHVHFFSLILCFCPLCAFHCPCYLVDLYLFTVICIVSSIVDALISMFHVILIFFSKLRFYIGLVHRFLFLSLSRYIHHHEIDHLACPHVSSFSCVDVKVLVACANESTWCAHKWPLVVKILSSCVPATAHCFHH